MDNEQDTCQAKGCDTFRCETNNSDSKSSCGQPRDVGQWTPGHYMPVIHVYTSDIQQCIKHCCLSESISSKKLQPVVFLFVFSSACRWLVSVHWAVQLQFNKPYGCWITLTSKYYKCPELDSCFHDSSKYQPRIIESVWHFVYSRKLHCWHCIALPL